MSILKVENSKIVTIQKILLTKVDIKNQHKSKETPVLIEYRKRKKKIPRTHLEI